MPDVPTDRRSPRSESLAIGPGGYTGTRAPTAAWRCKIPCIAAARAGTGRMIPTTRRPSPVLDMETARRENYDSGEDFVLEYGELRFTFNEEDFSERCEQAALKLGFVGGGLGEHVNDCWPELVGPAERSLVHWLRRLVFRGAWLDQRVKEGELTVAFNEHTGRFAYVQPADSRSQSAGEPIELAPEPSWGRVAYRR